MSERSNRSSIPPPGQDLGRRNFLKVGGMGAAALGGVGAMAGALAAPAAAQGLPGTLPAAPPEAAPAPPPPTPYPKLGIVTEYAPAKLEFAAKHRYEGVVVKVGPEFHPDLPDRKFDAILAAARNAGTRIISIEQMNCNHIDANLAKRREAQDRFIRCIEFAHRLGCKFIGTFSGGHDGASMDRQAKELAEVFNERYLPVCERLDMSMGWENYPCPVNFATYPDAWNAVFALAPSHRLGMEFDPSHLVRQYIDPIQAAWDIRHRILAAHAKDTEITQYVLQRVGINNPGWWRYRIPGQGLINWPAFITVLLQIKFTGGIAVEHEDMFWDGVDRGEEFTPRRQDGFILAHRFLSMYLPGWLES